MSTKKTTSLSQKKSKDAPRFFVVTPYVLRPNRFPRPAIPDCSCPLREPGDPPCDIGGHHLRPRETGPRYPLTVVKCKTHNRAFTLYPPGFAPYQRKPVLLLAPEGTAVLHERSEDPLADFDGTLFEAALDAKEGRAWARNPAKDLCDGWWTTQCRHLEVALKLLGLLGTTTDRVREAIAATLSVACMVLRDESRIPEPGYQSKGNAVCAVLEALTGGTLRGIRLLFCGYVTGKWGRPWTWDPSRRCLETLPFPEGGTTAPT